MDGWGARWKRQVEQALRFKNAAADNAQSVDLLVTVAEESDYRVNKATSFERFQEVGVEKLEGCMVRIC